MDTTVADADHPERDSIVNFGMLLNTDLFSQIQTETKPQR